jgi:RNA polymerase sigma factor (sigma-70 family)
MRLPEELGRKELFDDTGRRFLRFLALRLKDGTNADDLVQEAYLRLLRVDDPRSFALRVATHVAYEWGRLARHRREHVGPEALDDAQARDQEPFEQVLMAQNAQILNHALQGLTPTRRAILLMHIRDELTYAEIASRVGLSVSMVGKHLMLGLKACRQALAEAAGGSSKR